jgi:uncharacterized integral membrane protein
MNFIRKSIFFFVALLVFVIAMLAAADNSEEVALKFLDFQSPVWPISWWMLLAFVVGVGFGTVLNLVSNTKLRMEARTARKTAEGRTKELDKANAQPSQPLISTGAEGEAERSAASPQPNG